LSKKKIWYLVNSNLRIDYLPETLRRHSIKTALYLAATKKIRHDFLSEMEIHQENPFYSSPPEEDEPELWSIDFWVHLVPPTSIIFSSAYCLTSGVGELMIIYDRRSKNYNLSDGTLFYDTHTHIQILRCQTPTACPPISDKLFVIA
jgi:hypothetical protein